MTARRSLPTTKAYLRLRRQVQELFAFSVLCAYAVPALQADLDELRVGARIQLEPAVHYDNASPTQLATWIPSFEERMANTVLVGAFSYFEAYIVDALKEMIAFQGGEKAYVENSAKRERQAIALQLEKDPTPARKLRKPQPMDAMRRHIAAKGSAILRASGYRFPSELMAPYGLSAFLSRVKKLRAVEIMPLLTTALHVNVNETEQKRLEGIRDLRNKIAHGHPGKLTLAQAAEMNAFLRTLAARVEEHLMRHYFVYEGYV